MESTLAFLTRRTEQERERERERGDVSESRAHTDTLVIPRQRTLISMRIVAEPTLVA